MSGSFSRCFLRNPKRQRGIGRINSICIKAEFVKQAIALVFGSLAHASGFLFPEYATSKNASECNAVGMLESTLHTGKRPESLRLQERGLHSLALRVSPRHPLTQSLAPSTSQPLTHSQTTLTRKHRFQAMGWTTRWLRTHTAMQPPISVSRTLHWRSPTRCPSSVCPKRSMW